MQLISDILHRTARVYADCTAAADPVEVVTYGQLSEEVYRIARGLLDFGLQRGDRVALVLPNSVNFLRAHFAILTAGGVSVPCDAAVSSDVLHSILSNCRPRCVIISFAAFRRLAEVLNQLGVERVVLLEGIDGMDASVPLSATAWRELLMTFSNAPLGVSPSPSDVAVLMYTTGTTGAPRGVQLTHSNILSALRNITDFVGYTSIDREVVVLPLSHSFGLGHVYCNFLNGGAVYIEAGLSRVGRVLKQLEGFKATGFPGTPMSFALLLDRFRPALAELGRNLRFIVINSAPLPPERIVQLRTLLPKTKIMAYYGLTEASRSTFIDHTASGPAYYRSVGTPMKHVTIDICDTEGRRLPPGISGEVRIKGPTVAQGYWESDADTQAVFQDGWLRTGDFGYRDDKGFLFITGRLKEMVNVGGYKVSPYEVEAVMLKYPEVAEAAAFGCKCRLDADSEVLAAAVVPRCKASFNREGLERHCRESIEAFKVPSHIFLVKSLPRSETGKVKRGALARAFIQQMRAEEPLC